MFIFEGSEIETDSEGYLKETTQWSEAMAEVIAAQEGITLSVEHWEVVRFVRDFYLEFNTSPAIRMLVKAMANKFGEEKGNSRYLYRLFPKGPVADLSRHSIHSLYHLIRSFFDGRISARFSLGGRNGRLPG